MIRILVVLAGLISSGAISDWIPAQDGSQGRKTPLDLPAGGAGADDEEEDAPEFITFYGADYEGEAFFWCMDRSGSMQGGGAMDTLKQELTQAIGQLSAEAEFSLVRFSENFVAWSSTPKRATFANKTSAIGWVQGMTPSGGTCIAPACIYTLGICDQSSKTSKRVILVGDGEPTCASPEQTLEDITVANFQSTPIDTLFIAPVNQGPGAELFQQIAAANNGTYRWVN